MSGELDHLRNDYYNPNPCIWNNGFHAVSQQELNRLFDMLQPCDHPDMYAKIGNRVYIVEHFGFDASKETTKGMKGIKEENQLSARIDGVTPDGSIYLDRADYTKSLSDYQKNFECHFKKHYGKIGDYKKTLAENGILTENDSAIVAFVIECQYSPWYCDRGKFSGELCYIWTKQFADLYRCSLEIDFILYASYYDGKPQLFYIGRESLPPDDQQIDLMNPNVTLSSLNNNEVMMSGAFSG